MDGPGYSDDDLIDDYVDDHEEPDEYEQAQWEAAAEEQEALAEETKTTGNDSERQSNNPVDHQNLDAILPSANATETHTSVVDSLAPCAPTESHAGDFFSHPKKNDHLYSFERFTSTNKWRTESNPQEEEQGSKASASNLRFRTEVSLGNSRTSTSPDAQLLELLQKRRNVKGCPLRKVFSSPDQLPNPQPLTLSGGERIYIARAAVDDAPSKSTSKDPGMHQIQSHILGISMAELKKKSDRIRRTTTTRSLQGNDSSRNAGGSGQLWVDKHAPTLFSHLLSDERTNREALRALRAWDLHVFGREPPPRPTYERNLAAEHQVEGDQQRKTKDKRPDLHNRVLLLSGPPGVGKTTLAHIIATKAGYRPFEINASDDRSSSVLLDSVQRAMQSSTIHFSSNDSSQTGKPNCIILDEVDGADAKGGIQALVELIRAEVPAKGEKKTPFLTRPIIFICNHKYAQALRPLLPYARHFNVQPPSPSRLVSRLKAVLASEGLKVSVGGTILHKLVQATGGDIRSCMNTLQFVSSEVREGNDLSEALSLSLNGKGLKDGRSDLGSTLATVFRRTKKSAMRSNDGAAHVMGVFAAVERYADSSSTINSLFVNLPKISYIDPTFDRAAAAHEWLSFSDFMRGEKHSSHDTSIHYSTQKLNAPSAAGAIHLLCGVETRPNLVLSTRELSESYYQHEANQGLLQNFSGTFSPHSRHLKGSTSLANEIIPFLLHILSCNPFLAKPSSTIDMLSRQEREAVEGHVSILKALKLTYIVDDVAKAETIEKYTRDAPKIRMRLDPPLARLTRYADIKQRGALHQFIPLPMMELLAREVKFSSLKKENRNSALQGVDTTGNSAAPHPLKEEVDTSANKPYNGMKAMGLVGPPKTTIPKMVEGQTTFLGQGAKRAREAKAARKAAAIGLDRAKRKKFSHTKSTFLLSEVIRLRYVKGFTQAVRTPCQRKDLL